MASVALAPGLVVPVVVPVLAVVLVLRLWGRTGPASSHSSRAPSARTQAEGRLGGAVPRRRSRSSGKRAPRGDPEAGEDPGAAVSRSESRRVTSRAPRRATLPHCLARLGNGCSSSRVREEGRAWGPCPDEVRVAVRCGGRLRESLPGLGPERDAGGEPLPVPRAGREPPPSSGRRAAPLRRASPAGARPGLPLPALDAPPPPPVPRPVPPAPAVRRSALPLDRVDGRPLAPPAPPRPCPALPRPAPPDPPARVPLRPEDPERAGRAERADWARRFGGGDFGGTGRFYAARTAAPWRASRPAARGEPTGGRAVMTKTQDGSTIWTSTAVAAWRLDVLLEMCCTKSVGPETTRSPRAEARRGSRH